MLLQRHRRPALRPAVLVAVATLSGVALQPLVNTADAATTSYTIWPATSVPAHPADSDTSAVELGVKFRSDVAGYVTALRFYKGTGNTGTHVGHLWSRTGTLLASATFTNETSSGWQQVNLSTPVAISAATTYVASYYAPNGHYAGDNGYFATSATDSPPLHALQDGTDGGNGVYHYGTGGGFPTDTWQSSNYWVDLVFSTSTTDTTPPQVTATTPASGATGVSTSTTVTAQFSEPVQPSTVTMGLTDSAGTAVAGSSSYDATTQTETFTPSAALATSTTYTATVSGATDTSGNVMSPVSWSFTTASGATTTTTIWPSSATPKVASEPDSSAVELGVKFRSSVAGYVTALRFYKGSGNTGTHVGHLWSRTGSVLATATFTNETASGWQQVTLSAPVAVAANTTYVASYYAPAGHYAADVGYFSGHSQVSGPLTALADGTDGGNGVYVYGASGFPTNTYQSTNYWVDVVFSTSSSDTTPPTVVSTTPGAGATGVSTSTSVSATFSEPVKSTVTIQLKDPAGTAVAGTVSYDSGSNTATFTPSSPLAPSTSYTATVSGVADLSGNTMPDYTWSFTTGSPAVSLDGPGGPVLVVSFSADRFSYYPTEILRAEGLDEFTRADITSVTSTMLANYDVVVLAPGTLTSGQVTMLTSWVNAGGHLVALRPDKQLATLLGLTPVITSPTTLSDAYLKVNTAQAPGAGITDQVIQFHGTADRYTALGATVVATLWSSATTSTAYPAVTVRSVGLNGGQAAAFTYDLDRSVVDLRQGNPAWAGKERDGIDPIRSDDLYFGGSSPDWVNLDKVAIPQADEQQRLLANVIEQVSQPTMPLPKFWYFPRMAKAVLVSTGDDHGNGGTAGRFDQYLANSPAGCSVADWTCPRMTSYIYPSTPLSDSAAKSYQAQGFEIALHPQNGCQNFTPSSLDSDYSSQLGDFAQAFPSVAKPVTSRFHCIVWSDWSSQPKTELKYGIHLDTNYYYWPGSWVQDRPGFMTGSGIPMRFADTNGSLIDVYQAATQMTDESDQTYPYTIDTLLNNALGPLGYYGAFVANMHTDQATTADSDAVLSSALNHGVPIVSAAQMLTWLRGRDNSSFGSVSMSGSTLQFSPSIGAGANGLMTLLPTTAKTGKLSALTCGGAPVSYTTQTIKGMDYAVFPAQSCTYAATYAG